MLVTTTLALFLGFWSLLFLIDYYCRLYQLQLYLRFIDRTGLAIGMFHLKLYRAYGDNALPGLNALLRRPAIRRFLDVWFFLGVGAVVLSSGFMLVLLSQSLSSQLRIFFGSRALVTGYENEQQGPAVSGTAEVSIVTEPTSSSFMVPLIPGISLPWTQLPLMLLVLMAVVLFHELGHALAAVNENVTVNGFGVFIVGVYPGAFTELENMALAQVSSFRKLKIYCAGVWHNLCLALLALLAIQLIPFMSSFGYWINKGVIVVDVKPDSALSSENGLSIGNVIYAINNCKVYNEASWMRCLASTGRRSYGYCVPQAVVLRGRTHAVAATVSNPPSPSSSSSEIQCCDQNSTRSHLCFYYKFFNKTAGHISVDYACLPASYVTGRFICSHLHGCNGKTMCIHPALFNDTRLIRFFIADASSPVLFVGSVNLVAAHLTVSNYVPKKSIAPVHLPSYVELLCRYVFTLSFALALLNAVPCYSLDGQLIFGVLIDSVFGHDGSLLSQYRTTVHRCLMFYGSFVLVFTLILSLIAYFSPLLYL